MRVKNIIILILIIIFFGCKKEENKIELITNYVDSDLLDNFFFNEESYWIYENQLAQIDSITTEGSEHNFNSIPCPHGCPSGKRSRYEYFVMELKNHSQNIFYNYYFLNNHIKKNGGGVYCELGQPIFINNTDVGYEFNGVTVTEKYDSLNILGTYYYEVTRMSIALKKQYQQEFKYNTDLYFSPKIGLVKKVIYDTVNGTKTWNLKRYQLKE